MSKKESFKLIKAIQVTQFVYFSTCGSHYLLLTQNIDDMFIFVNFFYYMQYCLIAQFFVREISGVYENPLSSRILKFAIFIVFAILSAMTVYFAIELALDNKTYRDCKDPVLITSRVLGAILTIIYFYIAVKISYTLNSMKEDLDSQKFKENKRDMWILVVLLVIEGLLNVVAVIVQFFLDLNTCSFLDMDNFDGSFALLLIDRVFTYIVPFILITFVFWYSRKSDRPDFVIFLRESIDYTQYMTGGKLIRENING